MENKTEKIKEEIKEQIQEIRKKLYDFSEMIDIFVEESNTEERERILKLIDEEINFYTGKNMTYKEKIERNLESGEAGHKSVALIKLKQKLEGLNTT